MTNWLEYHEQPVKLHSGDYSHWLVRGDLMLLDKYLRRAVVDHWLESLEDIELQWRKQGRALVFNVYGVPTGGETWAGYLAGVLASKGYGVDLSTTWPESDCTIVVDDVITTGASMRSDKFAHRRLVVVDRRVPPYQDKRMQPTAWARMHLPLAHTKGDM